MSSRDRGRKACLSVDDVSRRDLLCISLLTSLPFSLSIAAASPINPEQTIIKPPDVLAWNQNPGFPERSVEMCPLTGDVNAPGLYYTLVRWWPGRPPGLKKLTLGRVGP
jgi:hypothetical protein